MTVSNFVQVSRRLAFLAFFVSASMGLVLQSDAQTATAKAALNFNVTSSAWFAGTSTQSDDGGNYDSAGIAPNFFIKALVNVGDNPSNQRAMITVNQHFTAVPYTGGLPPLMYDTVVHFSASTQATMQSADCLATHNYSSSGHSANLLGGIIISKKISSSAYSTTDHVLVTPASGDYVDVGQMQAGASSPGNANPPPGCLPGCG